MHILQYRRYRYDHTPDQQALSPHDTSTLWPICGRFNATERAIRRLQRTAEYTYTDGLEYTLALDSEISRIVNGEV